MKVVYSVATKFGGGGIGTTAYRAVLSIFKAGYLKRLWASSKTNTEIPSAAISETRTDWWERLPKLPSPYRWLFKDFFHDLITSLSLGPSDIFHVWNGHGLFSLRKAKKLGARVVVERASSHPLTYERIMDEELRIRGVRLQPLIDFNRKRLIAEIAEADFITVPSDFAYQSMLENGVPENKIVKIPFGVDLGFFRPSPLGVQRSTFKVLFAGQVGFRKGVLYLLEAWKSLGFKEAQLTIVGQTEAEIIPFLSKYRSDPTIRFLGFSHLLPLYQESDLFVFPSLEEGSALVTYEALACGLPVVTTVESGSVVENGREGFIIPPKNVEALAESIKMIYEDNKLKEQMSNHARTKAEYFSWERYGQSLLDFYRRIVI